MKKTTFPFRRFAKTDVGVSKRRNHQFMYLQPFRQAYERSEKSQRD